MHVLALSSVGGKTNQTFATQALLFSLDFGSLAWSMLRSLYCGSKLRKLSRQRLEGDMKVVLGGVISDCSMYMLSFFEMIYLACSDSNRTSSVGPRIR